MTRLPWPESCDKVMAQIGAAIVCGAFLALFVLAVDVLPRWIGSRW